MASLMGRERRILNRDWRFFRADVDGAQRVDFDDSSWQRVGLPHTFDLPYFRTPEFYVGYGWYRHRFQNPLIQATGPGAQPATRGRVLLEFDGVFQVAEVFVNGIRVGEHRGGYTGFCIDVTHALRPGQNLLAVRVNNNWDPQLQPRAGEHIFSGGIYRDVRLVRTDDLHVTWNGVWITTPAVSLESGVVRVRTELGNDSTETKRCTVITSIVDPDGKIVASMVSTRPIQAGQVIEFDQTSDRIASPKLWHPDHPHLYTVRTEVFDDDVPVDLCQTP
ncbi:MAG TPA: hypothetical protein VNL70_04440, partial [Tepidisphaeraceae bacterium]|nr:hypothetical protein [Tepidisphaeraceae bacterium]